MTPPFVHRLRVRYHECDAQGIVFNAHHFAFFDITLTELWREAFGSYDAMVDSGTDVVVADAQATFHASPRFDDLLDIEMTIEKLGNSSMVTRFEEKRDGELLVTGRMVHVFVTPGPNTKQQIPDDVRARLSRYVA
ncbi:MAG TPA: thioesterase family protein [Thermoleophilaceae bacterium]|nr:thioesterase family protein [Thermoleophilaceae bacterium]